MSKTKELAIYIAPMVAAGLLLLYATGAVSAACALNAAAYGVVLMGTIGLVVAVFERRGKTPGRKKAVTA